MKKLFILMSASAFLLTACGSVQDVDVTVQAAPSATVGEVIEVPVMITNNGTEERLLTSIDIGTSYLEGMSLITSEPNFTKEWDFAYIGFFSYDYQEMIQPGESYEVVYQFEASAPGTYEGSLDVCIDTESACVYTMISTTVQ